MRFDVHKVRTYLVNELNEATDTIASVRHDGTDVILVDLVSGESVMIYLIDRLMPVNEIRDTLAENTEANVYTLFVLWGDLLLPEENKPHIPEDWMEVLLTLYNGKIYGYDSFGPYASVFPVFFTKEGVGLEYQVKYGDAIRAANLNCDYIHVDVRDLKGFWRVADFSARPGGSGDARRGPAHLGARRNSMAAYFAVLDLPVDADRGAVKRAYYQLARQHHPDANNSPDSNDRMQQINEAYRRIMAQFDGES